ncbi:MAG TPA: prolyl oligopeptidase family serine peptidase [Terrimicrobiaceae bacterium]
MKIVGSDFRFSKTAHLNYWLHLPPEAQRDDKWPAILFLHGLGQSGDDPTTVLQEGLPAYLAQRPDFPFIVIAPQCPWNTWWPELSDVLDQLLVECSDTFPIDGARLYLTGLSMGGYGSWYLATLWPSRFAAVAPICGGGIVFHGFPKQVERLRKTPVWAFHGAKDDVVPLVESQKLVDALRESGGNVKFTIYPDAAHDSWTETYGNPELYSWFLSHRVQE